MPFISTAHARFSYRNLPLVPLACVALGLAWGPAAHADDGALALGATYTGDIWSNTRGGLARGEKYLDDLSVTASLDTDKAFGLPGGTLFVYALSNNSKTLSDTLVGDLQGVSNIDTGYATRLYEAWYEQSFASERASLKVGLYDLNSEFDSIDTAGLFISSSHGIGPDFSQTGLNGPSIFPVTSLAARFQFQINDDMLLRAAVLDAVPGDPARPRRTAIKLSDGALLVGEVEANLAGTTAAVGLWHYTSAFDDLAKIDPATRAPLRRRSNAGAYIEAERKLTTPFDDERGLSAFARVGFANGSINQVSSYAGAGVSYLGLLAARPDDTFGIAVAHARNGQTLRSVQALAGSPVEKAETSIEVTYRAQLAPWLTLQPDVQWVMNPGTDPGLKNAVVMGLRFEVGFSNN